MPVICEYIWVENWWNERCIIILWSISKLNPFMRIFLNSVPIPIDTSCRYLGDIVYSNLCHYRDVIMSTRASQITSPTIVYSTISSGADQRKHQSYASLAFVWDIYRWPVNSPHKGPVMRKMFPFDDVIMWQQRHTSPTRYFYGQSNMLLRTFGTCSFEVK